MSGDLKIQAACTRTGCSMFAGGICTTCGMEVPAGYGEPSDDLKERLLTKASAATDWDGETMKRWDEIRQLCAKRDGSDLPRLMFEGIIEGLAETMTESAARIAELEARLKAVRDVRAGEAAFEAAWSQRPWILGNFSGKSRAWFWWQKARAALDPKPTATGETP